MALLDLGFDPLGTSSVTKSAREWREVASQVVTHRVRNASKPGMNHP